jgi:nitrite reductase (NO-forming)
MAEAAGAAAPRRCRRPAAPTVDRGLRPSDLAAVFFAAGVLWIVAGAVTGALHAAGAGPSRWLAIHLAFVGGVSQLVVGASQFFVGAFLATGPPRGRIVVAQAVAWNAGALLVAVGVERGPAPLTDTGAALLLAGLALLHAGMRDMRRRSLQRARFAVTWYLLAASFLAAGVVLGALIARGVAWTHGDLLAAHLVLNVGGWLGTAIVGTLHTFWPSLTRTRLRFPRLEPWTMRSWGAGIALLALGTAVDAGPLAAVGWLALAGAGALLATNVIGCLRTAGAPLTLPALLVGAGQVALVLGLVAALVVAALEGPAAALTGDDRVAPAALLLAGWLAATVAGSLLHLVSVLVHARTFAGTPAARPLRDGAVAGAVLAAVVVLATAGAAGAGAPRTVAALVLAGLYGSLLLRAAWLTIRLVRAALP